MLRKNKIIYLILGIGIGIIITNIINTAYPKIEYIELSDEIIEKKAMELGMVKLKENIQTESTYEDDKKVKEDIEDDNQKELRENKEVKEIVIGEGSSLGTAAEALYQENLINSIEEFIFFVRGKKLDKKINIGTYKIKVGSTYTEIIDTITHRN